MAVASTPAEGRSIPVTDKISVAIVDKTGMTVGSVEINPAEFGGKINQQLLHDVVLMYLANQRAGTHSTLRRGEVAGSTKKLFRQKGTGNARAGGKRTNKRRGGGTAKGPKPRDYEYHLPKRAVRSATRMALLSKFRDGEAIVIDELAFSAPKTKEAYGILKAIKVGKKMVKKTIQVAGAAEPTVTEVEVDLSLADTTVLIVTATYDAMVFRSARNIEGVKVLPAAELNAYTLLKHKRLLVTRAALEELRKKKTERRPASVTQ